MPKPATTSPVTSPFFSGGNHFTAAGVAASGVRTIVVDRDIDPRPRECEVHYCKSPVPDDPICSVPKQQRDGTLAFAFRDQGKLVDRAGDACGPTDFVLMARAEDGSVSKAEGTVTIECRRE